MWHMGAQAGISRKREKPAIIERKGTKVAFVCRTSVGTPEMAATVDTPGVARYRSTRFTKLLSEYIQILVCCQSSIRFPTEARIVNNSRKIFGRHEMLQMW